MERFQNELSQFFSNRNQPHAESEKGFNENDSEIDITLNHHLHSMISMRSAACQANENNDFDYEEDVDDDDDDDDEDDSVAKKPKNEYDSEVAYSTEEDFLRLYGSEIVCQTVGTSNDMSATSLDEKTDRPKVVNVETMHRRLMQLENENLKLKNELDEERVRWISLEPRYCYLEKHFLKYLHVVKDYERIAAASVVPKLGDGDSVNSGRVTGTKSSQTYALGDEQLCASSSKILEHQNCEHFAMGQAPHCICICRQCYVELQSKFHRLVESLSARELVWQNHNERTTIIQLKSALCKCEVELDGLQQKIAHGQNCLDMVQRIVAKLAPAAVDTNNVFNITPLEKRWIHKIKLKFPSLEQTLAPQMDLPLPKRKLSVSKQQCRPVSRHDDFHSSDDESAANLSMQQLSKSLINFTLIDYKNCSAGDF